ncbi:MAG: hypothetical protein IPO08_23275 [Xanthomonadales bacterium]|nr:hypothetical protein [Xanthomonadales bacterium]
MTDKELLELAANAAGICLHPDDQREYSYGNWGCDTTCKVCGSDPSDARWNPLTDDGDALRLAVKIGAWIYIGTGNGASTNVTLPDCDKLEPHTEDSCAATRRAIVRAAAEIGGAMG